MQMKRNAFGILLVLLIFQKECRAVKCYQCISRKDKDCTVNKVDLRYLKPCPSTHPYCRKAVSKYYFMNSQEYSTTRECAKQRNMERKCYRGRYTRDSYQLTCECKGTGCNPSSKTEIYLFLYFLCHTLLHISSPT